MQRENALPAKIIDMDKNFSKKSLFFAVPPPPSNFKCTLNEDSDVLLSWDLPKNLKYTYLPTLYAVYTSVGEGTIFMISACPGKFLC